jgi:hypothetical protein
MKTDTKIESRNSAIQKRFEQEGAEDTELRQLDFVSLCVLCALL